MISSTYLRCSPGLGEHFQKKKIWPIAFPVILRNHIFEYFEHFDTKMNFYQNRPIRPVN